MKKFKVPQILSSEFNSLPKEKKDELVTRYENRYNDNITQAYTTYLEKKLESLMKENESSEPISEFQYILKDAQNKSERKALRAILQSLDWEV